MLDARNGCEREGGVLLVDGGGDEGGVAAAVARWGVEGEEMRQLVKRK